MAPHFSKPCFGAEFHPGMVVHVLFFQKWHLALGHAHAGSKFHDSYAGSKFHGPYAGVGALGLIWGGALGALGPIWGGASGRPKADIMEAEGRLNGGLGRSPRE